MLLNRNKTWLQFTCAAIAVLVLHTTSKADLPEWIWSPAHKAGEVPNSTCHFRRSVSLKSPGEGTIRIAADDQFDLYINGKKVGSGSAKSGVAEFPLGKHLSKGTNIFAIEVRNTDGKTAGLVVEAEFHDSGRKYVLFSDKHWRTSLQALPLWSTALYRDSGWDAAHTFGEWKYSKFGKPEPGSFVETSPQTNLNQPAEIPQPSNTVNNASPSNNGNTASISGSPILNPADLAPSQTEGMAKPGVTIGGNPVGNSGLPPVTSLADSATSSTNPPIPQGSTLAPSYRVTRGFEVQQVVDTTHTGALQAIAFNEFGDVIAAQRGGRLLRITDTDQDGVPETTSICCEKVKNCRGILALNGDLFVTGSGPEGTGLYRLSDSDRDGMYETTKVLIEFEGEMGDHGPQSVALGPEGLVYVVVGNGAVSKSKYVDASPHRMYYEGDLIPRYEDPMGEAKGVRVPGGVVLRTDTEGTAVQLMAGGLRNAADLAFDSFGNLFVHDGQMPGDLGTPWYRPSRLLQIVPGGEYGWRSGWSKWPDYFIDVLPPTAKTGQAFPAGVAFYDHHQFPREYHNRLFFADPEHGKIYSVIMSQEPGMEATPYPFVEGEPMPAQDVAVGPDGWLYFAAGNDDGVGGLYRVVYKDGAATPKKSGKAADQILQRPGWQTAWGRQAIAGLRRSLGKEWNTAILEIVEDKTRSASERIRAINLMQLFGPAPDQARALFWSRDNDPLVRARAADLLSAAPSDRAVQRLVEMIDDDNVIVRRKALQALMVSRQAVDLADLQAALASEDRQEAWAARRLLEIQPQENWETGVLAAKDIRVFFQGAVAMMVAHPTKTGAKKIVAEVERRLPEYISDADFVDLLRVVEIAIHRGGLERTDIPEFAKSISNEFPAADSLMNRELMRILARLQVGEIMNRYVAYIQDAEVDKLDRLHAAIHLRFIVAGWDTSSRMKMVEFLETAQHWETKGSYGNYLRSVTRDFVKDFPAEDRNQILAKADNWPAAGLGALYGLDEELDDQTRELLIELDGRVSPSEASAVQALRVGIVAVLAGSADDASMEYLRELWTHDAERRSVITMGLAQQPDGKNWDYLVRSLAVAEGPIAEEVLRKLATVPLKPTEAEPYRQTIEMAYRGDVDAHVVDTLMAHWCQQSTKGEGESINAAMTRWQAWYKQNFPDAETPNLARTHGTGAQSR